MTFSPLDNIDTNPNVYQAFDPFVVVDARMQYKVSQYGTLNPGLALVAVVLSLNLLGDGLRDMIDARERR